MKEFDLQAGVLHGQAPDPKAAFAFWVTHPMPGHQTLGTQRAIIAVPQESPPDSVDSGNEGGR